MWLRGTKMVALMSITQVRGSTVITCADHISGCYSYCLGPWETRIYSVLRTVTCKDVSFRTHHEVVTSGPQPCWYSGCTLQTWQLSVKWASGGVPIKWCQTCSCTCPGIYFPQDSRVYTSWLIYEPWKHFEKVKQTVHRRIICHK